MSRDAKLLSKGPCWVVIKARSGDVRTVRYTYGALFMGYKHITYDPSSDMVTLHDDELEFTLRFNDLDMKESHWDTRQADTHVRDWARMHTNTIEDEV